jgi:hypothetical protein
MSGSMLKPPLENGCNVLIRIACVTALLSLTFLVTDCAGKPYVPKGDEMIYGTWTSKTASYHKLVMLPNLTWELFTYESDALPANKGVYQIIDKWRDSEGNTWYKEVVTFTVGQGAGEKLQELDKIDKEGRVWQYDFNNMSRYDPANFPKQIDPKAYNYVIRQRASN